MGTEHNEISITQGKQQNAKTSKATEPQPKERRHIQYGLNLLIFCDDKMYN